MEITTWVGIVITMIIIIIGLKWFLKKSVDLPSLDAELHINAESQQPIIPRHVRDQLVAVDALESVATATATPITEALITEIPASAESVVETADVAKVEKTAVAKVVSAKVEATKATEKAVEIKNKVKAAEISEFSDESSVLEVHLHAQQRIDEESALATANEFIALNVFPDHRLLSGDKTLKVLMKYGLRYGEMSCFHRYNEDGSKLLFSVLQITDDGAAGFDLEALSSEQIKGLAFFLALPHADVQNAFDTMESTSRLIAREIDGTVYDQNHQEFSPHLREYWRHQAIDYRSH